MVLYLLMSALVMSKCAGQHVLERTWCHPCAAVSRSAFQEATVNCITKTQRAESWGTRKDVYPVGKQGSICHFAFSLVLQCLGVQRYPDAGKKQHEKFYRHIPFCVPQMLVKTRT